MPAASPAGACLPLQPPCLQCLPHLAAAQQHSMASLWELAAQHHLAAQRRKPAGHHQ